MEALQFAASCDAALRGGARLVGTQPGRQRNQVPSAQRPVSLLSPSFFSPSPSLGFFSFLFVLLVLSPPFPYSKTPSHETFVLLGPWFKNIATLLAPAALPNHKLFAHPATATTARSKQKGLAAALEHGAWPLEGQAARQAEG